MAEDLLQLDPRQVRPSPWQARQRFDDAEIARLAESLRAHGMLQPIVVRRVAEGFELVAGERRLRAAVMAQLARIPALVRESDDRQSALEGLVENMQRVDLDVFEEAEGYRRLMVEFGVSQAQVARLVGKSPSAVANKLRLLRLGDELRQLSRDGALGERHLRALLRVSGATRIELGRRAAAEKWTAGRVEQAAADISREKGGRRVRDVRIVLNAVRTGVQRLQSAGVAAEMLEIEDGGFLEVRIRIPRG